MKKTAYIFFVLLITFSNNLFSHQAKPATHAEDVMKKNALIIILMGPPGSGKGTHAAILSKELNIPHISTGDLFRENLAKKTLLGKEAQRYMDAGKLGPDELVLKMIDARLKEKDCENGFILDGFPRTIAQAKAFDTFLNKNHLQPLVLNLSIKDDVLVNRIINREICKDCGAPYNKIFSKPKKEGICDVCGGKLYHRKDDTKPIVIKRLQVYHNETSPLIDYYKKKGNAFYDINADGKKQEILNRLNKAIERYKKEKL